jgi:hypothetical protein
VRNKPILCVDFDGVIHSYTTPWKDAVTIPDPPVKGALKWLWKATEWWDIHIYSSRSKEEAGRQAMADWMRYYAEKEWEDSSFAKMFASAFTFDHEKPAAFLTIDDRCVCFEGDWSELDACELTQFKPWNKR